MVIGGLPVALKHRVRVELLSPSMAVIDDVEVGDDARGDGPGNGAPQGSAEGGLASGIDVESVSRSPNGVDTGNDASDWRLLPTTICAENHAVSAASPSSIVINEVVTDPKHDWSDSTEGNQVPFDAVPGTGDPDSGDQWIELLNRSNEPVDLAGWTVSVTGGTTVVQPIGGGTSVYRLTAGTLESFPAGARLIIGDPGGVLAHDALFELRDGTGTVIDSVQVGEYGAPDGGKNGGRCALDMAEAVARIPDGTDTGDVNEDFAASEASPGLGNPSPPGYTAGAVLINEVVTKPVFDWSDSTGGNSAPFDAIPGTGTPGGGDQWIELYNASGGEVNLTGWTLVMTDASAELQSIGGGASVYRLSSGITPESFPAGGYLVVGDPVGTMSNSVYIELQDAWGTLIDKVEIGDDPEGDGTGDGAPHGYANGVEDEAVARVPNGTDTGSDAIDFDKVEATIGSSNLLAVPTPTVTPTSGPTATPTITPTPTVTPTPISTPTPLPPDADTDNDGIRDQDEIFVYGTNPENADTDGDGLGDGAELAYWQGRGEDPLDPSYDDGDGTVNLLLDADADGDVLEDGEEISAGTDPLNPDIQPPTVTITDPEDQEIFN